jgi:hypothetical protein
VGDDLVGSVFMGHFFLVRSKMEVKRKKRRDIMLGLGWTALAGLGQFGPVWFSSVSFFLI